MPECDRDHIQSVMDRRRLHWQIRCRAGRMRTKTFCRGGSLDPPTTKYAARLQVAWLWTWAARPAANSGCRYCACDGGLGRSQLNPTGAAGLPEVAGRKASSLIEHEFHGRSVISVTTDSGNYFVFSLNMDARHIGLRHGGQTWSASQLGDE